MAGAKNPFYSCDDDRQVGGDEGFRALFSEIGWLCRLLLGADRRCSQASTNQEYDCRDSNCFRPPA
eukprot:417120-Amphidinium_carterae.1